MKKISIPTSKIIEYIGGKNTTFPKYTSQIINIANQNSQGTRPKTVGQLSDLIHQFPGKKYKNWVKWYLEQYPDNIDKATEKTFDMISKFKEIITEIDKDMVKDWIKDLVLTKTYIGLLFQESILKEISKITNKPYKLSESYDESKGIDGYIGNIPVSIKPITYKTKDMLRESINVEIVYYKKTKKGITIEFDDTKL